jgi:hypothetical protein
MNAFAELPQVPVDKEGPVERQSDYAYERAGYYVNLDKEDFTFEHIKRCWKRA